MRAFAFAPVFAIAVLACESSNNSQGGPATHVRNIRRMQPDANNATDGPKRPLEWGQLNILHTKIPTVGSRGLLVAPYIFRIAKCKIDT